MKTRLDVLLVDRDLAASRERARALILAGRVLVDGQPASKAGAPVSPDARIELTGPDHPYASRGGVKLAAGWLIEQAGWKGRNFGAVGSFERQALVLVNRGGATGAEVLRLATAIRDDVAARFLAYGWNVTRVGDANDAERLAQAIEQFRSTNDVPTLIIVDSHIGFGAPHKQDTSAAHGEPLGVEEIRLAKRSYGWPEDAKFLVPDGVQEHFCAGIGRRGGDLRATWTATRALRSRDRRRPIVAVAAVPLRVSDIAGRTDSNAGDRPAITPVASATAMQNSSTCPSRLISNGGSPSRKECHKAVGAYRAMERLSRLAMPLRIMLSVSN